MAGSFMCGTRYIYFPNLWVEIAMTHVLRFALSLQVNSASPMLVGLRLYFGPLRSATMQPDATKLFALPSERLSSAWYV